MSWKFWRRSVEHPSVPPTQPSIEPLADWELVIARMMHRRTPNIARSFTYIGAPPTETESHRWITQPGVTSLYRKLGYMTLATFMQREFDRCRLDPEERDRLFCCSADDPYRGDHGFAAFDCHVQAIRHFYATINERCRALTGAAVQHHHTVAALQSEITFFEQQIAALEVERADLTTKLAELTP